MSDYCIRLYKDSDYEVTRDLFVRSMKEHTITAFRHVIGLPYIFYFLLFVFITPYSKTGSIAISIQAGILVILGLWLATKKIYTSHVQKCLFDDMLDIKTYYMQRDGYCFWVAECAGEVVGTVAAAPSHYNGRQKHIELKRLSVAKSHRGTGIAKALAQTLIDFAQERGFEAVILEISLGQIIAQILFEKMGFRRTQHFYKTRRIVELANLKTVCYKYDIKREKKHQ
ncbi:N-acetyltransferase family 8 member 3-like [Rhinophrynus dorsalis]